jgi:hypothetical protein
MRAGMSNSPLAAWRQASSEVCFFSHPYFCGRKKSHRGGLLSIPGLAYFGTMTTAVFPLLPLSPLTPSLPCAPVSPVAPVAPL